MQSFPVHLKARKGTDMTQIVQIPEGATLQRVGEDVLITLPGAAAPYLCVQGDQKVRTAITRHPVDDDLADAARKYVNQHK
jgi:hypothetical protein